MSRRLRLLSIAAIAFLAWAPMQARATATVDVIWGGGGTSTAVASSATVTAFIYITPGPEGVASYGVSLQWDPTQLTPLASDCVAPNCQQPGTLEEFLPFGFLFNATPGIEQLSAATGEALTWDAQNLFGGAAFSPFAAGFIVFHATPTGFSEVVPGFHNGGIDAIQDASFVLTPANFNSATLALDGGTTTTTTTSSTTSTTTTTTTSSTTTLPDPKVAICHVSEEEKNDPAGQHTIRVRTTALRAHLAHGDSLGACP